MIRTMENPQGKTSTVAPYNQSANLSNVREVAGKSVCKIWNVHEEQGAGALFHVKDNYSKDRYLIITCNHVLPTNSLAEIIQSKLKFDDIQQMSNISLDRDHVQYVWTTRLLDATVIEISPELQEIYTSYGARFLQVGHVSPNIEIAILHFSTESASISHGGIREVDGQKLFYHIGNAPNSSGYPLLTSDCLALAMHNATGIHSAEQRSANSLTAVVNAYLQERSENEQNYLRLINQICFLRSINLILLI